MSADQEKEYAKIIAAVDQASALVSDTLPTLVWQLHTALKEKGFTEEQAFELTKVYLDRTLANLARNAK